MTVQKRKQSDLSLEQLKATLNYNAESGVFTNLVARGALRVGDEVGYLNNHGYRLIWLNGKWFLAHRLAVYYTSGVWPTVEVDHINRNPSDNRIANLRLATRSENMRNVLHGRGWHYHSKQKCWQSLIRVNKKRVYLGRFDTEQSAKDAYLAAVKKYHGVFAPPVEKPKQEAMI